MCHLVAFRLGFASQCFVVWILRIFVVIVKVVNICIGSQDLSGIRCWASRCAVGRAIARLKPLLRRVCLLKSMLIECLWGVSWAPRLISTHASISSGTATTM